jgi:hypothetical protein
VMLPRDPAKGQQLPGSNAGCDGSTASDIVSHIHTHSLVRHIHTDTHSGAIHTCSAARGV